MDNNYKTKSDPKGTWIEQLSAKLLPDEKRVRATLLLNEASSRPTIELSLLDFQQQEIARTMIIGVFERTTNFTLHLGQHRTDTRTFLRGTVVLNDKEISDTKLVPVERDN